MRGQLKIGSLRAPYLRAGLAWAVRGDVRELYIRELDGERLMELAQDAVLTVSLETAEGKSAVLRFAEGETVATYDDLISSFPELPSEPNALPFAGTSALDDIALAVGAAGFGSVDALIAELGRLKGRFPFELMIGDHGGTGPRMTASFSSVEALQEGFAAFARQIYGAGYTSLEDLIAAHTALVSSSQAQASQILNLVDDKGKLEGEVTDLTGKLSAARSHFAALKVIPSETTAPETAAASKPSAPKGGGKAKPAGTVDKT